MGRSDGQNFLENKILAAFWCILHSRVNKVGVEGNGNVQLVEALVPCSTESFAHSENVKIYLVAHLQEARECAIGSRLMELFFPMLIQIYLPFKEVRHRRTTGEIRILNPCLKSRNRSTPNLVASGHHNRALAGTR